MHIHGLLPYKTIHTTTPFKQIIVIDILIQIQMFEYVSGSIIVILFEITQLQRELYQSVENIYSQPLSHVGSCASGCTVI